MVIHEDAKTLVQVDRVVVSFPIKKFGIEVGSVTAVDGVSFSLDFGEAIAIVGESGSGKTTLIRALLGLNQPSRGRIHIDGIDVASTSEWMKARRRIGYVQQDPFEQLPPFMTVGQLLAEPLKINGLRESKERRRRIVNALNAVGLEDAIMGKHPHQLSGGQAQRVAITRALILKPHLVIADEPVSALDASVKVEILDLLNRLRREEGLALILVTHDLLTVGHCADKVMVMYGGRIVEDGKVDTVITEPTHQYTQALLAAIPDLGHA